MNNWNPLHFLYLECLINLSFVQVCPSFQNHKIWIFHCIWDLKKKKFRKKNINVFTAQILYQEYNKKNLKIHSTHLHLYLYGKKWSGTVKTSGCGTIIDMTNGITWVNVSRACSAAFSPLLWTKASSCIRSSLNRSSLFSDRQAARPDRATSTQHKQTNK